MPKVNIRDALNQALREEMQRDDRVFLMGEEVGFNQGAFKVSKGLLDEFGPMRVVDTPITEGGFTGVGIGAAMVGLRPIIEVMTYNFAIQAMDQIINNAAKIRQMSGGQLKIPLVLRGPGYAANRLAAQHSQAFDSYFCHVPGLKVVAPSTAKDAKGLLKSAIRDDNPVIFIEAQLLYPLMGEIPEGEYTLPIGKGEIKRQGSDVTILSWSKMVHFANDAATALSKEGIEAEVIDLRTLRPLDLPLILESVRKTGRVVIVEEQWPYCGVGAEVAYQIQHKAFDALDAPVERVTSEDVPVPYATSLEKACIPDPPKIIKGVKKVLYME